jgi:glucan phosphoethanolaminetransferase (alkaline phosphatase superfamily)
MDLNNIKEFLKIIEEKPLPLVVIISIAFLPFIISKWISLFPQPWSWLLTIIISLVWFCAIYFQWREIKSWRRKTRLVHYLKRHGNRPWRSFHHLTTEWNAKDDYSIKIIKNLISRFPEELRDVTVQNRPGVGLVSDIEKTIKDSE